MVSISQAVDLGPIGTLVLACAIVFVAYYIKGLSGFGTAMILVPTFAVLYDPATGITITTLFDMIAGGMLLVSVWKRIDWKFVIPVLAVFLPGAYLGVYLMKSFPQDILKDVLGAGLIAYIVLLVGNDRLRVPAALGKILGRLLCPVAFVAGFGGGLLGISGPLLVGYLKLLHRKTYFRDQVIAILAFGAVWRFGLYRWNAVAMNVEAGSLGIMLICMAAASWVGSRHHYRVPEMAFNRMVAAMLLVPTVKLFW
jgi:uncharacterized membrane protein YfcA